MSPNLIARRLADWIAWLQANHPSDLDVMFVLEGDQCIPQFTDEAIALFEARLAEWVTSTG
jgi:hypothetical protein